MVMRRALIDKVGLFDPILGAGQKIAAAEDTDYLIRAYLLGATIEYVPDMAVYHFHGRKTKAEGIKLVRGYSIGEGAMFLKYLVRHSDFARPFYWGIKNAIKEQITGQNLYMPEIGVTYTSTLYYNVKGMVYYLCAKLFR
jgi:GT2 family glycosyltransferase